MDKYLGIALIVMPLLAIVALACCGTYQPPGEDLWLYLSVVEKM